MISKADGALKWYCEECGDDIPLLIEFDPTAEVSGFSLEGFHIHFNGETVELPPVNISINTMDDFKAFAEVMRQVRETVEENE